MATPAKRMFRPEGWRAPDPPSVPPLTSLPAREPPSFLQHRRSHRHTYLLAFLISAAVHALAVMLYPVLVPRGAVVPFPGTSTGVPQPEGIQIVVIREVPGAPDPERALPAAAPAAEGAAAAPPAAAPPEVSGGAAAGAGPPSPGAQPAPVPGADAGGGSPASRLKPGTPDVRLWTLDPQFTRLTSEQIAKLELLWTILDMNASAAAAASAARALRDWTYTDDEGKRWGFADGKIYLGDLVLPFPFAFGAPANSDAAQKAWIDAEINRAAGSAAARENLNERIKAIRERLEQERRRVRGDSTRVPPGP